MKNELQNGVKFLGYSAEHNYIYSEFKNTFFALSSNDFTKNNLMNKFGPEFLNSCRVVKKDGSISYDIDAITREIILGCKSSGIFDMENIKGTGIFIDPINPNALIVNTGRNVWTTDNREIKGMIAGNNIFELGREIKVSKKTDRLEQSQINKLVKKLREWDFKNGDWDLYLLLGWIGVVCFSGIAEWRSQMFLTGVFNAGKSTLLKLIVKLLGNLCLSFTGKSSEAGIRQQIGKNATALILDEMESKHKTQSDILDMIRASSSGDTMVRGGADNKSSTTFNLRISALMAGIVPPNLTPSDRSRYIMIELNSAATSRNIKTVEDLMFDELVSDNDNFDLIGQNIVKFMIDHYEVLKSTSKVVNRILRSKGATERFAKTHETIIACAFMLMNCDSIYDRSFYKNDEAKLDGYCGDMMGLKKEYKEYSEMDHKLQEFFKKQFNFILLKEFATDFDLDNQINESNEFSDEVDLFELILKAEIKDNNIANDSVLTHIFNSKNNKSMYKNLLGSHGIRVEESEEKEISIYIDCNDTKLIKLLKDTKFANGDIKKVLTRHKSSEAVGKEVSIGNINRSRKGLIKIKLDATIYNAKA